MTTEDGDYLTCNCCGRRAWQHLFEQNGFRLGRCAGCGLHYVAEMPSDDQRRHEMSTGSYGETGSANPAGSHDVAELQRRAEFVRHLNLVEKAAPQGRWLDLGCGTGVLLSLAGARGIVADGIELTPSRRAIAASRAKGTVYDQPLTDLHLPDDRYAAVIMINVFSHLTDPAKTLGEIARVLMPNGILLLHTSEIGPGVRRHHKRGWNLGDHLYFLGDQTIHTYAQRWDYDILARERQWEPERFFSQGRLALTGPSAARNLVKRLAGLPGLFPLLRAIVLRWQRDNPIYASTILLKRGRAIRV